MKRCAQYLVRSQLSRRLPAIRIICVRRLPETSCKSISTIGLQRQMGMLSLQTMSRLCRGRLRAHWASRRRIRSVHSRVKVVAAPREKEPWLAQSSGPDFVGVGTWSSIFPKLEGEDTGLGRDRVCLCRVCFEMKMEEASIYTVEVKKGR